MLAAMKEHLAAASAHSHPAASASDSSTTTTAQPLVTSAPSGDPQLSSSDAAPQSAVMSTSTRGASGRDSSWLELEVCREHSRLSCPRTAEECRFAHPEPRITVKDGKVTCCYDFLKVRSVSGVLLPTRFKNVREHLNFARLGLVMVEFLCSPVYVHYPVH